MIILVRHGRTDVNAAGRLLGRLDPALDEVGVEQAARVAAALCSSGAEAPRIDRVVSSPLARAQATAAVIAATAGMPCETDERWIELDYGDLDGASMRDVDPAVWQRWQADVEWVPAGGESLTALGARVRAACGDLKADAVERNVVVVTHVSPIKAAVAWALGVGDQITWRLFVAPGSITRVAVVQRGPVLHSFNDVSHL